MKFRTTDYDVDKIHQIVEAIGLPSCSTRKSHSEIEITFPRPLTPTEENAFKTQLQKLRHSGADGYDPDKIRDLTPAQIDNWIDNNVTDLASARVALKKIGRALIFLYKRLEVDVS